MDETYKAAAEFAQTWGLAYFVVIFLGVLFYALWPSRKKQFDEAARIPLVTGAVGSPVTITSRVRVSGVCTAGVLSVRRALQLI